MAAPQSWQNRPRRGSRLRTARNAQRPRSEGCPGRVALGRASHHPFVAARRQRAQVRGSTAALRDARRRPPRREKARWQSFLGAGVTGRASHIPERLNKKAGRRHPGNTRLAGTDLHPPANRNRGRRCSRSWTVPHPRRRMGTAASGTWTSRVRTDRELSPGGVVRTSRAQADRRHDAASARVNARTLVAQAGQETQCQSRSR
jgi:hypothetical protein